MNRKEELLQKISDLFAKQGYEKTSIRDIAAHLGMTNAGLYYHFKNKQQMLIDIMNQGMDYALSGMRRELPQMKSAEERIEFIVRAQITFYANNKSQTKASIHEMGTRLDTKHAKAMDKKQQEYVGFIRQAIEQIIQENPYITIKPAVATYTLLGMLNWLVHWYDPEGEVSPNELISSIINIFLTGFKGKTSK
jgi:TetR/AcrR family transcriptional regulator, cholesterol catabolism regulator